jgi:hypothetical protein
MSASRDILAGRSDDATDSEAATVKRAQLVWRAAGNLDPVFPPDPSVACAGRSDSGQSRARSTSGQGMKVCDDGLSPRSCRARRSVRPRLFPAAAVVPASRPPVSSSSRDRAILRRSAWGVGPSSSWRQWGHGSASSGAATGPAPVGISGTRSRSIGRPMPAAGGRGTPGPSGGGGLAPAAAPNGETHGTGIGPGGGSGR